MTRERRGGIRLMWDRAVFVPFLLILLLPAACRNRDSISRQAEEYEVVDEGAVSGGVTSTIAVPGEQPPPVPAATEMTGTMVDTTTNFSLLNTNPPTSASATATVPPLAAPRANPTAASGPTPFPTPSASPTPQNDIYFSRRPSPSPSAEVPVEGGPQDPDTGMQEEQIEPPPPADPAPTTDTGTEPRESPTPNNP